MHHHIAVTGTNDSHVINTLCKPWEEIGDLDPALAIALERALCAEQSGIASDELVFGFAETRRAFLPVQLIQQRFGIESFQMAGTAAEEEKDHRLRLGRQKRFFGRQRISRLGASFLLRE